MEDEQKSEPQVDIGIDFIDAGDWREHLGACAEGSLILDNWKLGHSYPDREGTKEINGVKYTAKLWWCTKDESTSVKSPYDVASHLAVQVVMDNDSAAAAQGSDRLRAEMQKNLVERINYLKGSPVTALPQVSR